MDSISSMFIIKANSIVIYLKDDYIIYYYTLFTGSTYEAQASANIPHPIIGGWKTLLVKSTIVNSTNSTSRVAVYDSVSGSSQGITFTFKGYLQFKINDAFYLIYCSWDTVRLKNIIFETTYLSDADIKYQCNIDSSYCMGCNLINFDFEALSNPTSFDHCTQSCGILCQSCTIDLKCNLCKEESGIGPIQGFTCHCSSGNFLANSIELCQQCPALCDDCRSAADSQCTKCIQSKEIITVDSLCQCIDGYYLNYTLQSCMPCDPLCARCNGNPKACSLCISIIGIAQISGQKCRCQDEYYYSGPPNFCEKCHPLCIGCTNNMASSCFACKTGLGIAPISGAICGCQDSFFYRDSLNLCQKCHNSLCKQCINEGQNSCTECFTSESIGQVENGVCQCSIGFYFKDVINLCQKCHSLCSKCTSQSNSTCQECIISEGVSYLENSICNCLNGYYYDIEVSACFKCVPACNKCKSYSNCVECKSTEDVNINGKCLLNCTYSLSLKILHCIDCKAIQGCIKCTKKECLECLPSLILFNKLCSVDCPPGYFISKLANSVLCKPCHKSCFTCKSSMSYACISCSNEYQRDASDTYCVKKICKKNEFMEDYECYSCHRSCSSCDGRGEERCLNCNEEYIAYKVRYSKNVKCKKCNEIAIGMYYKFELNSCDGTVMTRNLWRWNKYGNI